MSVNSQPATGAVVTLTVPLPPVSLRANSRAFWRLKKVDADVYSGSVLFAVRDHTANCYAFGCPLCLERQPLRWPKAHVRYVWKYAGVEPDHSNLGGHTKYLQDILCVAPKLSPKQAEKYHRWHLGIVENDRGITAEYEAVKVPHRRLEAISVTVRRGERGSGEAS